jgi:hypothetical protein
MTPCDSMPAALPKSNEVPEPIFTSPIDQYSFKWNVSDLTKDELHFSSGIDCLDMQVFGGSRSWQS